MVDPRVSRFWQAALQSGLMDEAALTQCWDALAPEKRTADAADRRLARQAVALGHITLWQAQQLMSGKSTGFRIGKYVLTDRIGQGGMGRVYLARDTRLNRLVALKVLSPERVNNPRAIARFQREAKVGAQLQHENLVRIYDEGNAGGVRYLVMEYIVGKNLSQMIAEQGPMPPTVAARLIVQVAQGLEHAHQKGLIHRDVNPSNILVTHDGVAKLTDLGLAIDLTDQGEVTREGATVGTFDYISPEQARHSRSVDTRSDIYSLGCTFYHMIAGRVPFPGPSLPEKLFAHELQEPTPLTQVVPGVPAGLAAVVRKMMRKLPEDRYPGPAAVIEALQPFLSGTDEPTPTPSGISQPQGALSSTEAIGEEHEGLGANLGATENEPSSPADGPFSPSWPEAEHQGDPSLRLVDLEPGPLLGEGRSTSSGGSAEKATRPRIPTRRILAAAALGLAALAGAVALRSYLGSDAAVLVRPDPESDGPAAEPGTAGADRGGRDDPPPAPPRTGAMGPGEVAVRSPEDGLVRVPSLREAIERAMGRTDTEVLLGDGDHGPFGPDQAITVSGKGVTIAAADGAHPRLRVELKGGPWLVAKGLVPLTLRGLTIVAEATGEGEPPPLIQATGSLRLERCAFRMDTQVAGARAVAADGARTTIDGCWFAGFDRAIDLQATQNAEIRIEQSMIVRDRPPASAEPSGWGVRITVFDSRGVAGRPSPRLSIRRCTIAGVGLLEVRGVSERAALEVEVGQTAVKADALLAWGPFGAGDDARRVPPTAELAKLVRWSGRDNFYDLGDGPWIVATPPASQPTPDAAPTALTSWNERFASNREQGQQRGTLEFPARSSGPARPADYALPTRGQRPVGADAGMVGP